MPDHFKILKDKLPIIKTLATTGGVNGFLGQEVLRFYSIAGTLLKSFNCGKNANINERYITHILARSLIENYFWLIYIFDDSTQKNNRYQEVVNSFKRDYHKLINEELLPHKEQLEPDNLTWSHLPKAMDVNSMMAQIKNDYGERLNYLYFIYRISSFDTHGKNLENIMQETFGKAVNFPILDLSYAFDLMANQYLVTLQELQDTNEI
ncbi:hypothetical protein [Aliarcobacter butzleri]|uniref:hypothetical protein n=1 Tax=Aliarcobacter butzleri TaxID=28197 RepID=UPI003B20F56F